MFYGHMPYDILIILCFTKREKCCEFTIFSFIDVSKSLFGDSIETAFEVYVKEWFRRGKQRYHRQINTVRARNSAKF